VRLEKVRRGREEGEKGDTNKGRTTSKKTDGTFRKEVAKKLVSQKTALLRQKQKLVG